MAQRSRARAELAFDRARLGVRHELEQRMEAYVSALHAGQGLLAARGEVSAAEFAAFVAPLDLPHRFPGAQGIGFSRRLLPEEVAPFEEAMRSQGFPFFRVWPAGSRPEYHTIAYLEPRDRRNSAALGFDMSTEAARRQAMEEARVTGRVVTSGPVRLVQEIDADLQIGFLMFAPVFRPGSRELLGFVYTPFRTGDLFGRVAAAAGASDLDVTVYDAETATPEAVLWESGRRGKNRVARSVLDVPGRRWTLEVRSTATFEEEYSGRGALAVLLVGSLLTAFAVSLAKDRQRAATDAIRIEDDLRIAEVQRETNAASRAVAERELRTSRERLQLVLDAADVGTWSSDVPPRNLVWDAKARALFGIGPDDPLGTDEILSRIDARDRKRMEEATERAASHLEPYDEEFRVLLPDGSSRWIRAVGRVSLSRGGEPARFDGVSLDVTAQRLREERESLLSEVVTALSSSLEYETTLRALARLVVPRLADWCAVDLLDEAGELERVAVEHPDPAKLVLAEELMRRYPRPADDPGLRVLRTGEPFMMDVTDEMLVASAHDEEHLRIVRELRIRSLVIVPLVARGQTLGLLTLVAAESGRSYDDSDLAFARDLAGRAATSVDNARLYGEARRATEEAETLRSVGQTLAGELETEKLLQAVTDAATRITGARFGAFFYNVSGAGGESYRLFSLSGVPRQAFAGMPMPRNTALFGEVFRGIASIRIADVRQDPRYGGNPPYQGLPSGHVPVASFLGIPVVSRSADVLGGLFFGHPEPGRFTERHQRLATGIAASAAIALDNATLYESAERRAEALARSNAELEQFAYVASHDLQEPLRMVTNYLELLRKRYLDSLDERAQQYIGFAVDGGVRMHQLINDLLAFSRIGRNRGTVRPEAVALDSVVTEVLGNLELTIRENGAKVAAAPLPSVRADRIELVQLFQNLVGNALKYRSDSPPDVSIAAAASGREWVFSISDNGIGIAPSHHARIFEVFQRLHDRGRYPGTGIGLAICRKIVETLGGRIWVESTAGEGSDFRFSLPAEVVVVDATVPGGDGAAVAGGARS